MTNDLTTVFQLVLAFFACVGIVYLFRDVWRWIFKSKNTLSTVLTIDLTGEEFPIQALIDFASFYHDSRAAKYIKRIVVISDCDEIKCNIKEIGEALRLSLEL